MRRQEKLLPVHTTILMLHTMYTWLRLYLVLHLMMMSPRKITESKLVVDDNSSLQKQCYVSCQMFNYVNC